MSAGDLPELREHIRARHAALAGFLEQGAWLALEGDVVCVIPRKDVYIRYLNDNRASIGELASEFYGRKLRVEVSLNGNGTAPQPPAAERPAESDSSNPRPTPRFRPDWDNIPADLTMLRQWVLWRYEWRKDQWTKPPYQPDGTLAVSTDPATWSSFDAVRAAYETHRDRFEGIGFVLTANDPFAAFDFDHCLNEGFEIVVPRVADYVRRAGSFTEITPSGSGLRILTRATLPPGGRKQGNFEVYETKRYVTITGACFPAGARPIEIADRQAEVEAIHAEIFAERIAKRAAAEAAPRANGSPKANNLDDEALLDKARRAKNGERFSALYDRGDWKALGFPSLSEADLALCSMLAFWCGADKARVDQLFRTSGLTRSKWEERPDYRERTLETAIATCTETYESSWQNNMKGTGENEKRDDGNASASDRAEFKNGEAKTQCETFLNYRNVDEVREKLASFDARLHADINTAYSTEYVTTAAALGHFEPAEFLRLVSVLKGKGVDAGRWERTAREYERRERTRIAEAQKTAQGQARADARKARPGQGEAVELEDPEPAAQPVDGLVLVEDIAAQIRRFVIVDKHARIAVSLWILFTYLIDVFDYAPRLAITSPEMRCGKSTLLEVLSHLVRRALSCSNISPPAIFRTIDLAQPTLEMDELDSYIKAGNTESAEELRGILNSGHSRASGYVIRLVPVGEGNFEPRRFSTFTPIVQCLIGRLPATLTDRSIPVAMKRKRPNERVERLGGKNKKANSAVFLDLRRRIARWTQDRRDQIAQAEPALPESLNDREMNNWTPLVAIADAVDSEWGKLARAAAVELAGKAADSATIGATLLGDLRDLFREEANKWGCKIEDAEISSATICGALGSMETRLWPEWGRHRKPISQRQLASLLKPFSIIPVGIRTGDSTPRGYRYRDFEDVFSRYIPETAESIRNTATTAGGVCENDEFRSATKPECCGSKNDDSAYAERECGGVADEKPKRDSEPPISGGSFSFSGNAEDGFEDLEGDDA